MRIEKAECNYQVTECDLKFGEQITLDGELLISISVLDKIRAEIDEIPLSEPMVSADGLYCYGSKSITMGHFREKVFEIIDKYKGAKE